MRTSNVFVARLIWIVQAEILSTNATQFHKNCRENIKL